MLFLPGKVAQNTVRADAMTRIYSGGMQLGNVQDQNFPASPVQTKKDPVVSLGHTPNQDYEMPTYPVFSPSRSHPSHCLPHCPLNLASADSSNNDITQCMLDPGSSTWVLMLLPAEHVFHQWGGLERIVILGLTNEISSSQHSPVGCSLAVAGTATLLGEN